MKLVIAGTEVTARSGIAKATGRSYTMHTQPGRLTYGNGEVRNVEVNHDQPGLGLQAGEYEPLPEAFFHGKYGPEVSMKAKNWKLVKPLPATLAKAS